LQKDSTRGLDLIDVLGATSDREIVRVARLLQKGDVKAARTRLSEIAPPDQLKSLPAVKREQVNLLDGVIQLREGQYESAKKTLRASTKAQNANIAAFSSACVEVLKEYQTQYKGKPLNEPATFLAAGREWSEGVVSKVRDMIRDNRRLKGERRADYQKVLNDVRKYETDMPAVAVFAAVPGDDEMLRMWRLVQDASVNEIRRIDQAIREKQEQGNQRRGGGGGLRDQREIEDLQKEREKVIETGGSYLQKRWAYGFRIEDPDIQKIKEGFSAAPSSDDEGP
jgi:hypothetical protein